MMTLVRVATPAIYWAGCCALTPAEQLVWEKRGDELNKAMLYLMNLKHDHAKKDLRLVFLKET